MTISSRDVAAATDPIMPARVHTGEAPPPRVGRAPMRRWFANRALDALAKSLVGFALLHQVLIALDVLAHGDVAALNVFTMLEAERLIPGLGRGASAALASIGFALAVYAIVFATLTRPRARVRNGATRSRHVPLAPAAGARFCPTLATGLLALIAGLALHCGALVLIERFTSNFPSVTDALLARLPYVDFGVPGELCYAVFLATVATVLFRSQGATVPVILTRLGLFYAARGVFLFLLPIGSPVGAPALESRFVFYPWANHGYFPGGHAGMMTILCLAVEDVRWRRGLLAFTAVFAFGTLLARTHYTADVIGGALLGYGITAWSRRALGVRSALGVVSKRVGARWVETRPTPGAAWVSNPRR